MIEQTELAEHRKGSQVLGIIMPPLLGLAILAIGLILFSPTAEPTSFWHRSEYFFCRLIWLECIVLFPWLMVFSGLLPSLLKRKKQTGGGYVAMAMAA